MKKLFIFLFLIPLTAASQNTKTEDIFKGENCLVTCMGNYENDSLVSAYLTFDAKDDRLPKLTNYFTLCYDTPKNVFSFLTELENFISDNSSTTGEIGKHKVEIDKSTGTRTVKVFDERGLIFHRFTPKTITSIRTNLNGWALQNKVKLE